MEQRFVESPNGKTAYWITRAKDANAPCLVFLHGLTADHTLFERQIPFFSDRFHTIAWDAPAHGDSRPYENLSYADGAEALFAILQAEGVEKPVLIGQSMGGYHIQSFLLAHPDMAAGFVGIDTCPYGERYYSRSDRWWLRQVEWMARCYPYALLVGSIARSVGTAAATQQNMRQALLRYGKRELCRLMGKGYEGFLAANRDMVIPCPTVLLVGARDHTGKVRQYNRLWHEATGYPLTVIPNAAHNANYDAPDVVNRCIESFVQTLTF